MYILQMIALPYDYYIFFSKNNMHNECNITL